MLNFSFIRSLPYCFYIHCKLVMFSVVLCHTTSCGIISKYSIKPSKDTSQVLTEQNNEEEHTYCKDLNKAAENNDLNLVESLLKEHADKFKHCTKHCLDTIIHKTIKWCNVAMFKVCAHSDVIPLDELNEIGLPPTCTAFDKIWSNSLKVLPNIKETWLQDTVENALTIFSDLINNKKVDINRMTYIHNYHIPLYQAIILKFDPDKSTRALDALELIKNHKDFKPNKYQKNRCCTSIHILAQEQDPNTIRAFKQLAAWKGIDLNIKQSKGKNTPLHCAVLTLAKENVKTLLKAPNVKLDTLNKHKHTAFDCALGMAYHLGNEYEEYKLKALEIAKEFLQNERFILDEKQEMLDILNASIDIKSKIDSIKKLYPNIDETEKSINDFCDHNLE